MSKLRNTLGFLVAAAAAASATVVAQNRPPVADAGVDRFIYTGGTILLNGRGSDPDGDTSLSTLWSVDSAPLNAIYILETPDYPYSAFSASTPGLYGLSFKIFDGSLWSAPDTVQIRVADNQPPVAVIRATSTAGIYPLTVYFDGSASFDPDGFPLTYYWSFGDGSAGSYEAVGSHVYNIPGTFHLDLEVMDQFGTSDWTHVLIESLRPDAVSVPEPASGWLVAAGLIALLGRAKRAHAPMRL